MARCSRLKIGTSNLGMGLDNQGCEGWYQHKFGQGCLKNCILPLSLQITFPYIPNKVNFVCWSNQQNWYVFQMGHFTIILLHFFTYVNKHQLPLVSFDARKTLVPFNFRSPYLDIGSYNDFFHSKIGRQFFFFDKPSLEYVSWSFPLHCKTGSRHGSFFHFGQGRPGENGPFLQSQSSISNSNLN